MCGDCAWSEDASLALVDLFGINSLEIDLARSCKRGAEAAGRSNQPRDRSFSISSPSSSTLLFFGHRMATYYRIFPASYDTLAVTPKPPVASVASTCCRMEQTLKAVLLARRKPDQVPIPEQNFYLGRLLSGGSDGSGPAHAAPIESSSPRRPRPCRSSIPARKRMAGAFLSAAIAP